MQQTENLKSLTIDTSVIDFLQKHPRHFSAFMNRVNNDFNIIYLSEIVMHEILQGPSVDSAVLRIEVLLNIESSFKGKILFTKYLWKILKIEKQKRGRLNSLPCYSPESSRQALKNFKKNVLDGQDRKTIVYQNSKDYSKLNEKLAKKFRATVISEKQDHSKEYKEFTGIKPNANHKILARGAKLSSSQFNKMVRSDLFRFHKVMIDLTNLQVIRAAVPKSAIANKEFADIKKNDSIDALILTQASMGDAVITKDSGFFEIACEALKRGLLKCKPIYIFDYLNIDPTLYKNISEFDDERILEP